MRSPRPRTRVLGLARFVASLALLAGPAGCASSPGAAAKPAHRNNAERGSPFATAPEATVPDAGGTPRTIASLMGPRGLVLVLYRGHW